MAIARAVRGQWLLMHAVSWRRYEKFLRAFDGTHVRLTYDRGRMELRMTSLAHESQRCFIGRLVTVLTEECSLTIKSGGSPTIRKRLMKRGLEPDNCYWIQNEPLMRGKLTLDLTIDPPPDLALEMDISRSSLNRLAIYAALRVPEVWRFDGQVLTFHVLGTDGRYAVSATSPTFPFLKPADVVRFLPLRATMDENAVVREFRKWVRQQVPSGSHP